MDTLHDFASKLTQRGSPFELRDFDVKGVSCKVFVKGPQTLNDIYRRAQLLSQREYIVSGSARLTFAETLERATRLAQALKGIYAVNAGTHVAIMMRNSPEWIVAFIAITSLGAVVVGMPADAGGPEWMETLRQANCAVALCDHASACSLTHLGFSETLIVTGTIEASASRARWVSFDALLSEKVGDETDQHFRTVNPAPDCVALIAFTSGTTGLPKGVTLTHRNLVTGLMNMMLGAALSGSRAAAAKPALRTAASSSAAPPCTLMLAPFTHVGGYAQLLLMAHLGGKIVISPLEDALNEIDMIQVIDRERVRSLAGASPAVLRRLMCADRSGCELSSLAGFYIHGAALHGSLIADLGDAFPGATVSTGYGLTETCGSICVAVGDELRARPESSGQILPSVKLKLIDESGAEVPPGQAGEILVGGAAIMAGYWDAAEQTDGVLKDGWFRTGDLGWIDPDGYVYVIDRFKDLINDQGRQISSSAIERAATSYGGVQDAAVLGFVSLGGRQELVMAVVPDASDENLSGLSAHVRDRIVDLQSDLRIIPCKLLPRTASGKIDRGVLRQRILKDLAAGDVMRADTNLSVYQ